MALSHPTLAEVIEFFGYPIRVRRGVCYGFAGLGLQAILAQQLDKFDKRLSRINSELETMTAEQFIQKIKRIEQKRVELIKEYKIDLLNALQENINKSDKDFYKLLKKYKENDEKYYLVKNYQDRYKNIDDELSPEGKSLKKIHAFIELIVLYYASQKFPELFKEHAFIELIVLYYASQKFPELFKEDEKPDSEVQNAEATFLIALPDNLMPLVETKDSPDKINFFRVPQVKKIDASIGIYDYPELKKYFEELRTLATKFDPPIAFLLTSSNHAITVSYDSQKDCWVYIDAEKPLTRYCATDYKITEEVLYSFTKNHLTAFSAKIYCHENQFNEVNAEFSKLSESAQWKALHKVEREEPASDSYGCSVLWLASRAGNMAMVKKCLKEKDFNIYANQGIIETKITPLYIAILHKHSRVAKALIDSKDRNGKYIVDINKARSNGTTPLYLAAYLGNKEIVKMLVRSKDENNKPRIDVSKIDKKEGEPVIINVILDRIPMDPDIKSVAMQTISDADNNAIFAAEKIVSNLEKLKKLEKYGMNTKPIQMAIAKAGLDSDKVYQRYWNTKKEGIGLHKKSVHVNDRFFTNKSKKLFKTMDKKTRRFKKMSSI